MKIITVTLLISMLTYIGYDQADLKTEKWIPKGKFKSHGFEIEFTNEKCGSDHKFVLRVLDQIKKEDFSRINRSNLKEHCCSIPHPEMLCSSYDAHGFDHCTTGRGIFLHQFGYGAPTTSLKDLRLFEKIAQWRRVTEEKRRSQLIEAHEENRLYVARTSVNNTPQKQGFWFINDEGEIVYYGWSSNTVPQPRRFIRNGEGLIEVFIHNPLVKFE